MNSEQIVKDFKNWVYKVSRWKLLDFLKKQRQHKGFLLSNNKDDPILEAIPDERKSADKESELNQLNATLGRALATLNAEEKEVIYLHYMEERSFKEIATIINSKELSEEERENEATRLRQVCRRARIKLKGLLSENL